MLTVDPAIRTGVMNAKGDRPGAPTFTRMSSSVVELPPEDIW